MAYITHSTQTNSYTIHNKKYVPNTPHLQRMTMDLAARIISIHPDKVFHKIDLNCYRNIQGHTLSAEIMYTTPDNLKVRQHYFDLTVYDFSRCTDPGEADELMHNYGQHLARAIMDHVVTEAFESQVFEMTENSEYGILKGGRD